MRLESPAFRDGTKFPTDYTCDGNDISPHIGMVRSAPSHAKLLIVVRRSRCARRHMASLGSLQHLKHAKGRGPQAVNDFRRADYGGPCPPRGHGTHHYRFRLLALSIDHVKAKSGCSCADIERETKISARGSYSDRAVRTLSFAQRYQSHDDRF